MISVSYTYNKVNNNDYKIYLSESLAADVFIDEKFNKATFTLPSKIFEYDAPSYISNFKLNIIRTYEANKDSFINSFNVHKTIDLEESKTYWKDMLFDRLLSDGINEDDHNEIVRFINTEFPIVDSEESIIIQLLQNKTINKIFSKDEIYELFEIHYMYENNCTNNFINGVLPAFIDILINESDEE